MNTVSPMPVDATWLHAKPPVPSLCTGYAESPKTVEKYIATHEQFTERRERHASDTERHASDTVPTILIPQTQHISASAI